MNTTYPIKDEEDLKHVKNYYKTQKVNPRNHLLIIVGLNTALRVSDIIELKWRDVYNFKKKMYGSHIIIKEQKTRKNTQIYINDNIKEALTEYKEYLEKREEKIHEDMYLFKHRNKNVNITRFQVYRIVKEAVAECNTSQCLSCHSLRKTLGYLAWKQGISEVVLVDLFNHAKFEITKRYIGIEQEDKDEVFKNIKI